MRTLNKYEEIKQLFNKLKGRAFIYIFDESVIYTLIHQIITQFRIKRPDETIYIVVDDYNKKTNIFNKFNGIKSLEEINIKLLSEKFISTNYKHSYPFIITVGINDNIKLTKYFIENSKFILSIFTKRSINNEFNFVVKSNLTDINIDLGASEKAVINSITPVEEERIGVELNEEDRRLYDEYTDYINKCLSIFNSIDNIKYCRLGNELEGISAATFRRQFAIANGWSETLDTSIEYNKSIDDCFNPNHLYELSCNFNNIVNLRKGLILNNKNKIKVIEDIIRNNPNNKILIVNKSNTFITNLCKHFDKVGIKYGEYHDNIEPRYITDVDGNYIAYKTGEKKGQPKLFGARSISSLNMERFSHSDTNVLVMKQSSYKDLEGPCTLLIFSSVSNYNINKFRKNFNKVKYSNPLPVKMLFCYETVEHKNLSEKKIQRNVTIKTDDTENNEIYTD